MKAVVIEQPGMLKIKEVESPPAGYGEVLIEVQYCGICSTDNLIYQGVYSRDFLPLIPGHEFVGYIAAIGPNVKSCHVGDYVTADINLSCGTCIHCLQNRPLACKDINQIGIHCNGGFAELVVVPENKIIHLKDKTKALEYALVEPLSNVLRSFRQCGSVLNKSIVILGGNLMSLLHVQIARLAGAFPVTLITENPYVYNLGETHGADLVIMKSQNGNTDNLLSKKHDIVFETEGTVESLELAQQLINPGGKMIAFGIPPQGKIASYEPFQMILQEQSFASSVAGSGIDVYEAVSLIESGRLHLDDFTKTIFSLDDFEKSLDLFNSEKNVLKVLIEVSK
jgi:2-desacetyl-2-hydroxyethyl bacteriochlorophyllide A dehydrogenase